MGYVLWLVATGLLVIAALLTGTEVPGWLRLIAVAAQWIGPLALLLAIAYSSRRWGLQFLRRQLIDLAGPALVRAMPPRTVLDSLLERVFGTERAHQEILTGLLGGPGREAAGGDTAVSRSTSVFFQVESVNDKECINYVTWTHEYAGVRNNHRFVIFLTCDQEIVRLVQRERAYPLYELWSVAEEDLEEFVPALQDSLRVGITYVDTSGNAHRIEPRPAQGEEVAYGAYERYLRLPAHVNPQNLRIVQLDLHDLAHDDHVVDAVEAVTMRFSSVAAFDLGYLMWTPPYPCFVRSVTYDTSLLARPGDRLVYLVVLATIRGATLPVNQWLPLTDRIEVPVDSWMLTGHNVTLLYRPIATTELPYAPPPE